MVIASAFGCTVIGFAVIHLATHALLARHAIPGIPVVAAFIVELGTLRAPSSWTVVAFVIAAITSASVMAVIQSSEAGWESFAPTIAQEVRACPQTRVIALDAALLLHAEGTSPYAGMQEAIEGTFLGVADKWNFPVTIARERSAIAQATGGCPTLIWLEHNFGRPEASLQEILAASGAQASPSQVAATRRIDLPPARTLLIIPSD